MVITAQKSNSQRALRLALICLHVILKKLCFEPFNLLFLEEETEEDSEVVLDSTRLPIQKIWSRCHIPSPCHQSNVHATSPYPYRCLRNMSTVPTLCPIPPSMISWICHVTWRRNPRLRKHIQMAPSVNSCPVLRRRGTPCSQTCLLICYKTTWPILSSKCDHVFSRT